MTSRSLWGMCGATVITIANGAAQTNAPPAVAAPTPSAELFAELKSKAEAGDPDAEQKLGMAYYNGQVATKDYQQAFEWCLKAANQGNAHAEYNVAWLYERGLGVAKDDALAFQWYLKCANAGIAVAGLAVGNDYFYGNGVGTDPIQAADWYHKAAVLGDAEAQIRYGVMALKNTKYPDDMKAGFTFLQQNAMRDAYAAFWIACCYRDGIVVAKNPVHAYAWYLHASSLPAEPGTKDLPTATSLIKSSLTAEQISRAQKEVGDFSGFLAGCIQPSDFSVTFDSAKGAVIPFDLVNNAILVPVKTRDGKPAYLLFDTGCAASCLDHHYADQIGLKSGTYFPMVGVGENVSLSTLSDETEFGLPGLTFKQSRWVITPDSEADCEFGKPIVGFLGLDLVMSFVIRIDFIKHTMEVIKQHDFQPPVGSICLPLNIINMRPSVEASVISGPVEIKSNFLIDTGDTGSFDLTKVFLDQNPSLNFKKLTTTGASGFGGVYYSDFAVCPTLRLGEITLSDVPLDLERSIQGYKRQINGMIGTELWRRFNVTFDFPHRKLYLQKNDHFSDPHSYAGPGMHLLATGNNYQTLTVHEVLPDSAAAHAGFQTGDVLVKIDELGDTPLGMSVVYPLFHKVGTCHCHIRRGELELTLSLELKDLVVSGDTSTPPIATPPR